MAEHEMQAVALVELAADTESGNTKPLAQDHIKKNRLREGSPDDADDAAINQGETLAADEPTEREKDTLRRVGESLPVSAWLVAVIELCERFTYYGCVGLFQNYIQRPLDGSLGRGALGLGHQSATSLTTFFSLWCYVTPILGAIVADQYLGRYKAIVAFSGIYMLGLLILILSSLPASLNHGAGLGGFIAAILVIGIGTGGIKSNVGPLIADQYRRKRMAIKILSTGERVIIDPTVTIQRIYLIFYFCINVGALSLLATPYMERDIGFWSAFVLCICVFTIGFTVLVLGRNYYVIRPPTGSVITNALKAIGIMIRHRNMDAPKQAYQDEFGRNLSTPWDDQFVEELKRALVACKVFLFYPIYWVVYSQFSSNFVSQAGQMDGHGVPNDLMQNFDPIAILIFVPIFDRLVFPYLRKKNIKFRPIARISVGFVLASLSMAYAAVVQHLIYSAPPCYGHPLKCPEALGADGVAKGNKVHIAVQAPAYVFIGISEIFASVTGLEYAYLKAPPSMKSFVQSMFLLTNAFGYALGEAFIPLVGDPTILWLFVGLCGGSFLVGVLFYAINRGLDEKEDEMNGLEGRDETRGRAGDSE